MPYNSETETFYQAPATVVDSTPDGDTVQEGFDDRLTPALAGVYADFNLLKADGMISVGIPATTTARGIGRVATSADLVDGATITNGPAFLSAGDAAIKAWIRSLFGDVGDLVASLATSKTGHLLCNGGLYSRTTYAGLFTLIGTAFGAGDGSTTFKVPDFRGRTIQGANANLMAVLAAGLPNIVGSAASRSDSGMLEITQGGVTSGAFKLGNAKTKATGNYAQTAYDLAFDASLSSAIYGASTTVQPPAIAANIFIKY